MVSSTRRSPEGGIPVLAYHYIGDTDDPDDRPNTVALRRFEAAIGYLHDNGYTAIGLDAIVPPFPGESPFARRTVAITFDDGHRSCYSHAFPVLRKYGMTATIFLISSRLNTPERFLTLAQIREMQAHGFRFESHSVNHRRLTTLTRAEFEQEARQSKLSLEDVLGQPVTFFAYPFGEFDRWTAPVLQRSGYQAAVCTAPGLVFPGDDLFRLTRMGMRRSDSLRMFRRKLRGDGSPPLMQRLAGMISSATAG